jgi:anti-sigma factor RsiW
VTQPCCRWASERLVEYVDEALSRGDMRRLAGHLTGCPECRLEADDHRRIKTAIQLGPVPVPDARFWLEVGRRARGARPRSRRSSPLEWVTRGLRLTRARARALTAGAALAAALLGASLVQQGEGRDVDDTPAFIAEHAEQSSGHPLSDWSRLTLVGSEAGAAWVER